MIFENKSSKFSECSARERNFARFGRRSADPALGVERRGSPLYGGFYVATSNCFLPFAPSCIRLLLGGGRVHVVLRLKSLLAVLLCSPRNRCGNICTNLHQTARGKPRRLHVARSNLQPSTRTPPSDLALHPPIKTLPGQLQRVSPPTSNGLPPPPAPVNIPPHPTKQPAGTEALANLRISRFGLARPAPVSIPPPPLRNLLCPWGPCPYPQTPPEPKPLDFVLTPCPLFGP